MSREVKSPVYQIDFTAVDAGKRIASTKRRIRWRFGFTNQDALAAGETGTACRGEEHDITLIWSLTSGKCLVLADGQEVHYSNSRSQVFDFSWTMRGNHVLKVIAHATNPMNAHPNFRQYDFFVDGMSFFSMPKVYRLGLTGADHVPDQGALALAHSSRTGYGNYSMGGPGLGSNAVNRPRGPSSIVEIEAPHNEQEEEAYLREAIKASLSAENAQNRGAQSVNSGYNNQPQGQQEDLLIDFMSEPGPVPAPAPAPNSGYDAFAVVPSTAPQVSAYAQPPPPQQPPAAPMYAPPAPAAATPAFDSFAAPPPAAAAPPTPTYNYDYSQPPTAPPTQPPAPAVFAPMPPAAPPAPAPAPAPPSQPEQAPALAAPVLSMAPQNTGLGSNANDAYAKFASMDQFDLVKPKHRSNPFDDAPAPAANTGSLADMKAKNANVEKKEVMKNTMVVAPQQGNQWGGYNNYSMQGQAPMAGGMNGMGASAPAQPMMQQSGQYGMPPAPSMGGAAMPQQGYQQPGQYGYGQQPPQQPGQYPPMQGQHPSMQGYPPQQQGYGAYGQQPF